MRRAPPLVIAVLPQRGAQAAVAVLVTLAGAGVAWRFLPMAAWALPLLSLWAWRSARVTERRLRWDGERWWLAEPGPAEPEQAVKLRVVIDLDGWLLVRATPATQNFALIHRYLPLNRGSQGAIWGALRATLYSARVIS